MAHNKESQVFGPPKMYAGVFQTSIRAIFVVPSTFRGMNIFRSILDLPELNLFLTTSRCITTTSIIIFKQA